MESSLDLNEYLIKHPAATFFVRVAGDSMREAGIHSGDLLVVDRAVQPKSGSVVVAILDGEFTVKRLQKSSGKIFLVPESKHYRPIEILPEQDFSVWGVVSGVVRKVEK